jgi:hypothetical protein
MQRLPSGKAGLARVARWAAVGRFAFPTNSLTLPRIWQAHAGKAFTAAPRASNCSICAVGAPSGAIKRILSASSQRQYRRDYFQDLVEGRQSVAPLGYSCVLFTLSRYQNIRAIRCLVPKVVADLGREASPIGSSEVNPARSAACVGNLPTAPRTAEVELASAASRWRPPSVEKLSEESVLAASATRQEKAAPISEATTRRMWRAFLARFDESAKVDRRDSVR